MTGYEETMLGSDFRGRKTGLVVFGILQIILGAFCALSAPFMILGMISSTALGDGSAPPMNPSIMIPGILFYILLAVWFIWMGIGSIKARRWARALILVSSWLWLIGGICGLVLMLLLMPDMYGQMGETGQIPPEIAAVMKYAMTGFMTVFFVIIPGVFVLFYGSKNVKATCEHRDSEIRWTDKCPLPVLALSLMFGSCAFFTLWMVFYGCVIPFFGFLMSGFPGALMLLVVILSLGSLAWGTYKLKIIAWWGAIALTTLGGMSWIITLSHVSLLEFYEKMNFPKQQIELIHQYGVLQNSDIALYTGLWFAGFLGYLLYTRRYFVGFSAQERAS